MKIKLFIILLVSCFFVGIRGYLGSLSGRWTGTLKDADDSRDYPLIYNLKIDGNQLTGTGLNPHNLEDRIINGKVTGNDFTFDLPVDGTPVKHTGKYIAAGDSVSLNIYFGGRIFHSTLIRSGEPK